MKARFLILAGAVLLVVGLLLLMWPMTRRTTGGPRLDTLNDAQKLISSLREIETACDQHSERANALRDRLVALHVGGTDDTPAAFTRPAPESKSWGWPEHRPEVKGPTTVKARVRPVMSWPDLDLTGVIDAGPDSIAIMNGLIYRINSKIDSLRVAEIRNGSVLLVSPTGETRRLRLSGWDEEEVR